MATLRIESFTGQYAWASNFHLDPLTVNGTQFPSVEHAFQAAKTLDAVWAGRIAAAATPAEAKALGRRCPMRPDWERSARFEAMTAALTAKFTNPDLQTRLLGTGDALLVEGNAHHDQLWGACWCREHVHTPGANHLGRILMRTRARLRGDAANRWVRVACTGNRPHKLTDEQAQFVQQELVRVASKLAEQHGTQVAISGAALGADTWWATAAVQAGLSCWTYVPSAAQAHTWSQEQRQQWQDVRAAAAFDWVIGCGAAPAVYHVHNEAMLRDCDAVVAVHDPHSGATSGGTVSTVAKAKAARIPVVTVDVAAQRTTMWVPSAASRT